MLTGIDSGTPIKVLAPMQADAIAMVSRNDIDVKGWEAFQQYVKDSKRPVLRRLPFADERAEDSIRGRYG